MKRQEFLDKLESIFDTIYEVAYMAVPHDRKAYELAIDAISVFFIKEKSVIKEHNRQLEKRIVRKEYNRFIVNGILRELVHLSFLREHLFKDFVLKQSSEHEFYFLSLKERLTLFMKEKSQFSVVDLQDIFGCQKHEVTQTIYSSRHKLSQVLERYNSMGVTYDQ